MSKIQEKGVIKIIYTLSNYISSKICVSDNYDKEIVSYGCELFLATALNTFLLLIIALMLGYINEMAVFIMFFGILRISAGGLHAKNHLFCFIYYFFISFTGIYIASIVNETVITYYIFLSGSVSLILIYMFAPAMCKNRPLTESEQGRFKKRSRVVIWILLVVIIFIMNTPFWRFSLVAANAVLSEALLTINFKKKKGSGIYEKD